MKALREWLVKHDWFILVCDPNPEPGDWLIDAISPAGIGWRWTGTAKQVGLAYPITLRAGDKASP